MLKFQIPKLGCQNKRIHLCGKITCQRVLFNRGICVHDVFSVSVQRHFKTSVLQLEFSDKSLEIQRQDGEIESIPCERSGIGDDNADRNL
jgi:hypothetical protein